jgi:hypothetical protein
MKTNQMCNGNCNQGRSCDCVTYVFDGLFTLGFMVTVLAVGGIVGFLVGYLVGE